MAFSEWVVIILVAILVIRPKDLPQIAHKLGCYLRYFKNVYKAAKTDVVTAFNTFDNSNKNNDDITSIK